MRKHTHTMSKPKPNTPPQPTTTTTQAQSTALATPAAFDELAELDLAADEIADDGLSEANQDDVRIPVYTLNFPGMTKAGRPVPPDVFYNTVDEVELQGVDAVFISLHKTNMYSTRDKSTNKRLVICSSHDQVQGNMNGTIRPCAGCPDAQWRSEKDEQGKDRKTRRCDEIYNVYSGNRATGQPFIVRFKRTALKPFKNHLQKHHLKRRLLPGGQRTNYPLYVFSVHLTGKMAGEGQKHALPVIERGDTLGREEILLHAAAAKEIGQHWRKVLASVEKQAERTEAGEDGDTSFDTSKYDDAVGQDYVPASTPAPAPANQNNGE